MGWNGYRFGEVAIKPYKGVPVKAFNKTLLATAVLATLSACAPGESENQNPPKNNTKVSMTSDILVDNQKVGEISRRMKTEEEVLKIKEKKRSSALTPVPVNPVHSASVYKLAGQAIGDQYFVAPRVYVYSGMGLNSFVKNRDGSVVIPFNIALIDGLSSRVHIADASGPTQEVPDTLRIRDYKQLHAEVAKFSRQKEEDFAIGALPGCPSRISINVAGTSYDVTPNHLSESDYCEINKPFTVNLQVPEAMARYILGDALRSSLVDIAVNYAVVAPVPVSELSVKFNKEKLYEAITINLQASYPPYGEAELEYAVEKALKSMKMNIYIQGDYNEQMKRIVSEAIREFYVKMPDNPERAKAQKCQQMVCLTVKQQKFTHEESFEVHWMQAENMRMEKVLRLGSKLRPVNDIETTIGRDASIGTPNAMEFSNKNPNPTTNPYNAYSVGLTPQRGMTVLFEPTLYSWERRKREEPLVTRRDWRQCTGRVGVWNECSYTTRTEYTYTYDYTGDDVWVSIANPLNSVPRLVEGLKAYFQFSNGEVITCLIQDMHGSYDKGKRAIHIENTSACRLFDADRKVITGFGLINTIMLDNISYTSGQKLVSNYSLNWDNTRHVNYSPTVNVAGKLTLLGGAFVSGWDLK